MGLNRRIEPAQTIYLPNEDIYVRNNHSRVTADINFTYNPDIKYGELTNTRDISLQTLEEAPVRESGLIVKSMGRAAASITIIPSSLVSMDVNDLNKSTSTGDILNLGKGLYAILKKGSSTEEFLIAQGDRAKKFISEIDPESGEAFGNFGTIIDFLSHHPEKIIDQIVLHFIKEKLGTEYLEALLGMKITEYIGIMFKGVKIVQDVSYQVIADKKIAKEEEGFYKGLIDAAEEVLDALAVLSSDVNEVHLDDDEDVEKAARPSVMKPRPLVGAGALNTGLNKTDIQIDASTSKEEVDKLLDAREAALKKEAMPHLAKYKEEKAKEKGEDGKKLDEVWHLTVKIEDGKFGQPTENDLKDMIKDGKFDAVNIALNLLKNGMKDRVSGIIQDYQKKKREMSKSEYRYNNSTGMMDKVQKGGPGSGRKGHASSAQLARDVKDYESMSDDDFNKRKDNHERMRSKHHEPAAREWHGQQYTKMVGVSAKRDEMKKSGSREEGIDELVEKAFPLWLKAVKQAITPTPAGAGSDIVPTIGSSGGTTTGGGVSRMPMIRKGPGKKKKELIKDRIKARVEKGGVGSGKKGHKTQADLENMKGLMGSHHIMQHSDEGRAMNDAAAQGKSEVFHHPETDSFHIVTESGGAKHLSSKPEFTKLSGKREPTVADKKQISAARKKSKAGVKDSSDKQLQSKIDSHKELSENRLLGQDRRDHHTDQHKTLLSVQKKRGKDAAKAKAKKEERGPIPSGPWGNIKKGGPGSGKTSKFSERIKHRAASKLADKVRERSGESAMKHQGTKDQVQEAWARSYDANKMKKSYSLKNLLMLKCLGSAIIDEIADGGLNKSSAIRQIGADGDGSEKIFDILFDGDEIKNLLDMMDYEEAGDELYEEAEEKMFDVKIDLLKKEILSKLKKKFNEDVILESDDGEDEDEDDLSYMKMDMELDGLEYEDEPVVINPLKHMSPTDIRILESIINDGMITSNELDRVNGILSRVIENAKSKTDLMKDFNKALGGIYKAAPAIGGSAGGEGSRGGKIIGHTKSGKAIYDSRSNETHSSFNIADAEEAYELHSTVADAMGSKLDAWKEANPGKSVPTEAKDVIASHRKEAKGWAEAVVEKKSRQRDPSGAGPASKPEASSSAESDKKPKLSPERTKEIGEKINDMARQGNTVSARALYEEHFGDKKKK